MAKAGEKKKKSSADSRYRDMTVFKVNFLKNNEGKTRDVENETVYRVLAFYFKL